MEKFDGLKKEYEEICSLLNKVFDGREDRDKLEEGFLAYYETVALWIWGKEPLFSPEYTKVLNHVLGTDYTMEQIATSLDCCRDDAVYMIIPPFYRELVAVEKGKQSARIRKFLSLFNELLVGTSLANGDFTILESTALTEVIRDLVEYAKEQGISVPAPGSNEDQITERREDSYLKKEELSSLSRSDPETGKDREDNEEGKIIIEIQDGVNNISHITLEPGEPVPDLSETEPQPKIVTPAAHVNESMESLLEELDSLVGLTEVKNDVHGLMNFIRITKIRQERGMKVPTVSYHLVFTGNPGTGKTTVARLVAKLYYQMGILPTGQLVETDRSALVAGYLGQTAIKTQKVIQQALGGVLFIDEAYSLANDREDSYGKEAIETILKAMEDHRDELVVIVAGYTDLMHQFIDSNPGLSSRFSKYFTFPDYTGEELLAIFRRFCRNNGYALEDAADSLKELFDRLHEGRDEHFGNARTARNIFEKAINAQANRLALNTDPSDRELETLTVEDLSVAIGGALT